MNNHQPGCKELLGNLSDYVDGTLGEALCQEIEQHLASCTNCRVVVDTLRKTIYLYHETARDPADVPPHVRERLYRALDLEDYLKH
jgi:anti-sigma factor RsiW